MTARSVRAWWLVHKWTSLVSTAFLLMLCVTGLALIFHHEIDDVLQNKPQPREMPAGTPWVSLDRLVEAATARRPGEVIHFFVWDRDEPNVAAVFLNKDFKTYDDYSSVQLDARTGEILRETTPDQYGFIKIMFYLHINMFAGLPGTLFLGAMGILLLASIASGAVLYGRFMRRLDFGTQRTRQGRRLLWLDRHNLLGVVTMAWLIVVGVTGVINTLTDPLLRYWRADQLASMLAPYRDRPTTTVATGSLEAAVATGLHSAPGMRPSFVSFPGTRNSSAFHYAIFFRGESAWSSRLLTPALVDAETAKLTEIREMPWYIKVLLLSQPLHFGDYGGMPLKILWAFLDIVTIVVLSSGLYLWLSRRRSRLEELVEEMERGGVALDPVAAKS